jgi:hypothetical protein
MSIYSFEKKHVQSEINLEKIDVTLLKIFMITDMARDKEYIFPVYNSFLKDNIDRIIALSIKKEYSIMLSIDNNKWNFLTTANKKLHLSDNNKYIKFCRLGG